MTETVTFPATLFWTLVILTLLVIAILLAFATGARRAERTTDSTLDRALREWGVGNVPPSLVLFGGLFWLALFLALAGGIGTTIYTIPAAFSASLSNPDDATLRWTLLTLTAMTGALGAVVALPFTLVRIRQNERQTTTTEQGLIVDRINKAVEALGAERMVTRIGRTIIVEQSSKQEELFEWQDERLTLPGGARELTDQRGSWTSFQVSEPNISVRVGGVLALEHLARSSLGEHVQVMEILTAHIQENSKWTGAAKAPRESVEAVLEDNLDADDLEDVVNMDAVIALTDDATRDWAFGLEPLPADVQMALNVIARRTPAQIEAESKQISNLYPDGYVIDLSRTNLQSARLSHGDFANAILRNCRLEGADLSHVNLQGADLTGSFLHVANMFRADLRGAVLSFTSSFCVDWLGTHFDGETRFQNVEMDGCVFLETSLPGDLSQGILDNSFAGVEVSEGSLDRPKHWPTKPLSDEKVRDAIDHWREARAQQLSS